ncbi:MAG: hypothetical protein AAB676_08460 [Verrucomicrobiota bacterium]
MEWSGWEKLGNLTTYDEGEKGSNHSFGLAFGSEFGQGAVRPRKIRVESPGAIYHVMNRGDRREDIFLDWRGTGTLGLERSLLGLPGQE